MNTDREYAVEIRVTTHLESTAVDVQYAVIMQEGENPPDQVYQTRDRAEVDKYIESLEAGGLHVDRPFTFKFKVSSSTPVDDLWKELGI